MSLLVIALVISMPVSAQKTYLKITKSNKVYDYVMYPPGTKFELKNAHGYIVFKNSENPGALDITEDHTLYVFPSWKKEADVFKLTEGRVEKILTSQFARSGHIKKSIAVNGVTAEYTTSDSKTMEDKKNLIFKLSNGITFEYNNGKYKAYLNKEENYLHIEGKYLIESDFGILKLSFNPSNGIVWWIFEPVKE